MTLTAYDQWKTTAPDSSPSHGLNCPCSDCERDAEAGEVTDEEIRKLQPCSDLSRIEIADALRSAGENGGLNIRRAMARARCAEILRARQDADLPEQGVSPRMRMKRRRDDK